MQDYQNNVTSSRALGGILKLGGPILVNFLKKKILKGPLFSKFSKSGWAMPHLAHPPTRALQEAIYVSILITEMKWLEMHFFAPCSEKMGNYG